MHYFDLLKTLYRFFGKFFSFKLGEPEYRRLTELLRARREDFRRIPFEKCLTVVRSWSGAEVALAVEESNIAEKLRAEFGTPSNFEVSREELACHSGKLVELLRILERQRARRAKTRGTGEGADQERGSHCILLAIVYCYHI